MFDAGYVQASDREDTGKASGTRYCEHVQEPRANARRLMKSRHAAGLDPVSLRNQPPRAGAGYIAVCHWRSYAKMLSECQVSRFVPLSEWNFPSYAARVDVVK